MTTHHRERKDRFGAVRSLPPFAGCSERELGIIDSLGTAVRVPPGRKLAVQGEMGRQCFLVEDGAVRITHWGCQVDVLRVGTWVGEMALLHHLPRNATATTLEPTTVWVFDPGEFAVLLDRVPSVAEQLTQLGTTRRAALDQLAS